MYFFSSYKNVAIVIVNDKCNLSLTISLRQDAHGSALEICRQRRLKSGAVNDKVKYTLSFTIILITVSKARLPRKLACSGRKGC